MKTTFFLCGVLAATFCCFGVSFVNSERLNVRSLGAPGDGVALDTVALQSAVDGESAKGGGTVWIPAGRRPIGTLKTIRIHDVVAEVEGEDKSKAGAIMIAGIPDHYVEDVVLENITLSYPGGGAAEDGRRVVPEDIARYPEQLFFGTYIRFENVRMGTRVGDARPARLGHPQLPNGHRGSDRHKSRRFERGRAGPGW